MCIIDFEFLYLECSDTVASVNFLNRLIVIHTPKLKILFFSEMLSHIICPYSFTFEHGFYVRGALRNFLLKIFF